MVVKPHLLKLIRRAANVPPLDVHLVGLAPVEARRLTVGGRWAIRDWVVVGSSIRRTSYCRGLSRYSYGPSNSPLWALMRRAGGLLLVTLSDVVDVVGLHPGSSLDAGDAVTGMAAGVFRERTLPLPADRGTDQKLKTFQPSTVPRVHASPGWNDSTTQLISKTKFEFSLDSH